MWFNKSYRKFSSVLSINFWWQRTFNLGFSRFVHTSLIFSHVPISVSIIDEVWANFINKSRGNRVSDLNDAVGIEDISIPLYNYLTSCCVLVSISAST